MEDQQLYRRLVRRYLDNEATKEELDLFFHLLEEGKLDAYLEEIPLERQQASVFPLAVEEKKLVKSYNFLRYAVAASLLMVALTGIILVMKNSESTIQPVANTTTIPQAAPGTKKARLILSDGQSVELGTSSQTLHDGGTEIITREAGVVYDAPDNSVALAYNTIATPKGGEYQVTLPDGTKVWLNAETSLRYPTAFTGKERRVELTGEAYFEVTKNTAKLFIVQSGEAVVKVLGTHFNVMAYSDESVIKTTLAEGSVSLSKNGSEKLLQPGQGALINKNTDDIIVSSADVELDLAWKNGNFYFQKTELSVIMKQLARWYDLEIRYTGAIPKKRFVGRISRYTNLSEVLDVLRLSDIKFSMTGKTLTVEG